MSNLAGSLGGKIIANTNLDHSGEDTSLRPLLYLSRNNTILYYYQKLVKWFGEVFCTVTQKATIPSVTDTKVLQKEYMAKGARVDAEGETG